MKIIPTNIRWSLLTGVLLLAVHCGYITAQNEKTESELAWHPEAFYIVYPDMKLTFKLPHEKDQSGVANLLFKNKETGTIHLLDTVKNNERYCNQLSGKYDAILLYNNGKYIIYNDVSFEKNISTEVNMENLNIQSCDPDSQYWLTLRKFNTAIGTRVFPENYATNSNKKIRGYIFLERGWAFLMGAAICQQDNRCKITLSDGYFEIDTDSYQTLKIRYLGAEDQTINIKTNSGLFLVMKNKDLDLTEEEMSKIKTGTLFGKKVESGIHTPFGQKVRIGGVDPNTTAVFVNNVYIGDPAGSCIAPSKIDSIRIVKEPIEINGISFKNQVHCFASQEFKFVSLQELLEKYRNKNKPLYAPVFMINGTVLTGNNVLSFKVDEDCFLELDCTNSDELGYWEGKERFTLVSISMHKPEKLQILK